MQSVALREAIKEYEANKWKVIGQKVGKPAKVSPNFFTPFVGRQGVLNWSCRHANSMQRNISGLFEACWWNLTKWRSLCIGYLFYLLPPQSFSPLYLPYGYGHGFLRGPVSSQCILVTVWIVYDGRYMELGLRFAFWGFIGLQSVLIGCFSVYFLIFLIASSSYQVKSDIIVFRSI